MNTAHPFDAIRRSAGSLIVAVLAANPALSQAAGTDEAPPIVVKAGPDWIPLPAEPWIEPGSALDFSGVVPHDEPAGKFGRVVAVGDHFEFEGLPGVKQRFYGVNICRDSNTPATPEAADRFAANLARVGYNAVRIHHHERWLLEKNGDFSDVEDSTVPDAVCLDRFDAFVAACIRHGIYVTTDLYVSRCIPWRDVGFDRDGIVPSDDFKLLCAFWEPAFSNLCAWSRGFLSHVNPYTGRSLAEEPALCTLALVNEGNLGVYGIDALRRTPGTPEKWEAWCAARRAERTDFPDDAYDPELVRFLADAEMHFASRLRAFLRDELGCKAPLTSINRGYNPVQYQLVREKCFDFVDAHYYVDHPKFIGETKWQLPSRCDNRNPLRGLRLGVPEIAFRRLLNKPFCVSEWNYAGPSRYRGMGGIVFGALSALQDWSGLWRFSWSGGLDDVERPETLPMHYWEMCRDPLSQAAERAVLCLFLRGDLAPLGRECPAILDEAALLDPAGNAPECDAKEWRRAAWLVRLGTKVEAASPPTAGDTNGSFRFRLDTPAAQVFAELAARGVDATGNGAVAIDPIAGTILVDTPRTCGGFAGSGAHEAGALRFAPDSPATIWASSLDGKPLSESSRILLTHLTDLQNSDIRYRDADRSILLDWGGLPHLVRRGTAGIELAIQVTEGGDFTGGNPARVFRLSPSGRRVGEVPAAFDPATGRLAFTARTDFDPASATYLYEIVR